MIVEQKAKVRSYKNIFLAVGFYYMMRYFVGVLRWRMCFNWRPICNNYTMVLSCVPGPKKPLFFEGLRVHECYYLVPGAAALGCGVGVITYNSQC